ncbi:hypothetical protein KIW84_044234 [Lathyrus oleraceus]|uniref:AMP deaminase n=1 Tax=Pisum sativum TaxID=3888 RepID=A0A9D5AQ53_PEA|nr:hypothetical protein KIW84_044234 [Pisum sativum]
MNQKHLLRFIKSKLRKESDEVVIFRDGTYLTLKEIVESLDLTGYNLNVDLLDVRIDKSTFHRFDKFNLRCNPCGQSRLREIFLKQDNLIQGRFLAEVTKQVFSDLKASKYHMAEYRIPIYGRKQSEWDQLASWIVNNELYSQNMDIEASQNQVNANLIPTEWAKIGDANVDKSEELLCALDNLPVNLRALQTYNVRKSVNNSRSHENSKIQRKSRTLVDTWKKRVKAEMNTIDTKIGSTRVVSWPTKPTPSDVSHSGNRKNPEDPLRML